MRSGPTAGSRGKKRGILSREGETGNSGGLAIETCSTAQSYVIAKRLREEKDRKRQAYAGGESRAGHECGRGKRRETTPIHGKTKKGFFLFLKGSGDLPLPTLSNGKRSFPRSNSGGKRGRLLERQGEEGVLMLISYFICNP